MPKTTPVIGIPCRADTSAQRHHLPLFGAGQRYVEALANAGAAPLLIPLHLQTEAVESIAARLDGLLLAGGEDVHPALYGQAPHPRLGQVARERDELEIALSQLALQRGMPLLAICRGIQVLTVATGGTLYQDLASQRPQGLRHDCFYPEFPRDHLSHLVELAPDSAVAGALESNSLWVNSMHHQGIDRLGEGWVATAHAPDGLIEAIEAPDHPFAVGLQWHPEELVGYPAHGLRVFEALVKACRQA
ncbi:MAG: gamma-glutamyl-gamma-aminobutyrate hydrolase family protein [Anaerolineae bacterium]